MMSLMGLNAYVLTVIRNEIESLILKVVLFMRKVLLYLCSTVLFVSCGFNNNEATKKSDRFLTDVELRAMLDSLEDVYGVFLSPKDSSKIYTVGDVEALIDELNKDNEMQELKATKKSRPRPPKWKREW